MIQPNIGPNISSLLLNDFMIYYNRTLPIHVHRFQSHLVEENQWSHPIIPVVLQLL